MPVIIVDDESVAAGVVTDHGKCEQCKSWIAHSRLCYCENCDIIVCVFCVYKSHIGTSIMLPHDVFWTIGMEAIEPAALTKCANLRCRDFKYEHKDACSICERSVAAHMTKQQGDLLRCHKFMDESTLDDSQRFWQSFDYSCGVTTGNIKVGKGEQPPSPHTSRETLYYVAMVRHWGWSVAMIERMLKKAILEGKVVEVPESMYHRAAKHSKVLVKVEKYDDSIY